MLAGACVTLREANCSLIGGHSSEGSEEAFGLAVNGTALKSEVLSKGRPRDGEVLILTKAIGTGAIMAADMRGYATGKSWHAAVKSMLLSNQQAAKIFFRHGCNACTDVTGFGVIGHLLEMLTYGVQDGDTSALNEDGSDTTSEGDVCRAILYLDSIPLLNGAKECVEKGVSSSLTPQVRYKTQMLYFVCN